MIVVAIIGIIIAIAIPAYLRARESSRAHACQENLTKIDQAMTQYALEHKLGAGQTLSFPTNVVMDKGTGYLKREPRCPGGGTYDSTLTIGVNPTCSIGTNALAPFAPHVMQ